MTSTTFFFVFIPILAVILLAVNLIFAPHNPAERCRNSLKWEKLSNSGDPLKFLVPSYNRKVISGWTNYSDNLFGIFINYKINKVTSQKMIEREMGYRGSKSVRDLNIPTSQIIKSLTVKEQRVDGSWCINQALAKHKKLMHLRCTLMGFERNYQVRIPSNLIKTSRNNYSVLSSLSKSELTINPWYITGFTDGEGCFIVTIIKDNKYKLGWRAACRFIISLNDKDINLLKNIKSFFKVGNIYFMANNSIQYRVESLEDLTVILDHFDKHPLITKKHADYLLFKSSYELIKNKKHLTKQGLIELISLKSTLNNGLLLRTGSLKAAFSDSAYEGKEITPILRPEIKLAKIMNPNWLVGFVDAEGCFYISIFKSSTSKLGEAVKLSFIITQHIRDEYLMKSLIEYLGCGNVNLNRNTFDFKVTKFSSLNDIIIPFFEKYPLHGVKAKDFEDFSKTAKLVQNKTHLTAEGLNKIRNIKAGMNTGRV